MSAADTVTAAPPASSPAEKPKHRWEAADSVIAASIALVVFIVGIFVFLCVQGYSTTIETAKTRMQTAAGVVAEETRWVYSATLSALESVAASIGDDPSNAGADTLLAFQATTDALPAEVALGIYDANGRVIVAASSPDRRADIADADYFEAVAAGSDWALSSQERDPVTDEGTFSVVRRLGGAGALGGAAVATIDASVLRRLAESQELGAESTISITRSDGWLIARNPPLSTPLNGSDSPNFRYMQENDRGSYVVESSAADGMARIVGFEHVRDLGYIAVASTTMDAALAGLWTSIWIVSLLIAPTAVALLVGSFLTANLLRRSQSTSRSLAAALEHNESLFREIHHRVKNNLQSVNSLLQVQPIPREVKANMSQRIAAMSAVHEHIYRSNAFAQVSVKGYLDSLVEGIRAGHDPRIEVVQEIEDVAVDKDAAMPLALIVNEVLSNAFKHAFPDGRGGVIHVKLADEGDGLGRLTVRDNGVGFDPATPAKGIGRRLVQGFTSQLRGESEQTSGDGSVFTLTFPLAKP